MMTRRGFVILPWTSLRLDLFKNFLLRHFCRPTRRLGVCFIVGNKNLNDEEEVICNGILGAHCTLKPHTHRLGLLNWGSSDGRSHDHTHIVRLKFCTVDLKFPSNKLNTSFSIFFNWSTFQCSWESPRNCHQDYLATNLYMFEILSTKLSGGYFAYF